MLTNEAGNQVDGLGVEAKVEKALPDNTGPFGAVPGKPKAALRDRGRPGLGDVVEQTGEPGQGHPGPAADLAVELSIKVEPREDGPQFVTAGTEQRVVECLDSGQVVVENVVVVKIGLAKAPASFEFGEENGELSVVVEVTEHAGGAGIVEGFAEAAGARHQQGQARGCALSYSRRFSAFVRWVYTCVVEMLAWPSASWTLRSGMPPDSICVAKV